MGPPRVHQPCSLRGWCVGIVFSQMPAGLLRECARTTDLIGFRVDVLNVLAFVVDRARAAQPGNGRVASEEIGEQRRSAAVETADENELMIMRLLNRSDAGGRIGEFSHATSSSW